MATQVNDSNFDAVVLQSQLPVLLAEYTFRTKRDVTDYLALLDQIDDYFASLLLYEQEKAAA